VIGFISGYDFSSIFNDIGGIDGIDFQKDFSQKG
jgi:hypothetical protein